MTQYELVTLITMNPEARGVGTSATEIYRKRFCQVRSVSQSEVYQAAGAGLSPEYRLILAYESEYHGERECFFRGERYRILRTYIPDTNGIELTIQRIGVNADV